MLLAKTEQLELWLWLSPLLLGVTAEHDLQLLPRQEVWAVMLLQQLLLMAVAPAQRDQLQRLCFLVT